GSPAMSMRWRGLVSTMSLAAFLLANVPPLVSLRASTFQSSDGAQACSCCCSGGSAGVDTGDMCCCCRSVQANETAAKNEATADDQSVPACPCPYCPAASCQNSLLNTLACLATETSTLVMPPCLEHLGPEAAPLVPAGPCDDVMHPPRT